MKQFINLKKLGILVLLVVASIQHGYSQLNIGLKSGINLSKVQDNLESADYTNRAGFYGGAIIQKGFTEKGLVRAEILYSVKGSKFLASPNITTGGKSSFHYVNIPILLGYRPIKNLAVVAGPEVGYLINAKTKHDGQEADLTKQYKRLDLAADFGAIYQLTPFFGLDARYSYGFKLMRSGNDPVIGKKDGENNAANRVIQVGIFYHFTKQE